ncbi:MAG TPA: YciI family protein, partial [Polyangiaceae bacterium]
GPPPALMEAMGKFVQKALKDGTLVDTGGLLPSKDGVLVRLAGGKITVTDGPFTESKEVIGGWAIVQADSKAEAVRIATEFMELHRVHWPGFDGESEVRPMFDPGMGP